MELVYIYLGMSFFALIGIIWIQIKLNRDRRRIL